MSHDALRSALWSIATSLSGFEAESYRKWIADEALTRSRTEHPSALGLPGADDVPLVTFIIAGARDRDALLDTLETVRTQVACGIEVIVSSASARLADFASTLKSLEPDLVATVVCHDGSTAEAEEHAIGLASGRFVAFLSEGDRLARGALFHVIKRLEHDPKLEMIFSDEDWIDRQGKRLLPRFKTGWDPYAQLGFDLPGRLCLMRLSRVRECGGMRPEHAPAHHYDLHSRLGKHLRSYRICHLPHVLYHRHIPSGDVNHNRLDEALASYARAAQSVAGRITGEQVEPSPIAPFVNKIAFPIPEPAPLVTVMVPTRDRADLLRNCARGVLTYTSYPNIELLILDNDSREPKTAELFYSLARDSRVRILQVPGPFNYSRINNLGALQARGEILVLLNNDVEVIGREWLTEMIRLVVRPDVGCVGVKLLYADQRIQHAGVILDTGPLAMHAFRGLPADALGHDGQLACLRSYSAVTAACLGIRRDLFMEVRGFDEDHLQIAYNDIDLCLKTEEAGYINICTPFARLFHLEGASRAESTSPEKQDQDRREGNLLFCRWPDRFRNDFANHPNLKWGWDEPITLVTTGRK